MKGAGETPQHIEYLPNKHEDLSLNPESTLKTAGRERQAEI